MKLTNSEIARLESIKKKALIGKDYGEISLDDVFSLAGDDVPWMCKLIDRIMAEEQFPVEHWHPCMTCGTQNPCPNGCEKQRRFDMLKDSRKG